MKTMFTSIAVLAGITAFSASASASNESRIDGYLLRAEVEAAESTAYDPFDITQNPYAYEFVA